MIFSTSCPGDEHGRRRGSSRSDPVDDDIGQPADATAVRVLDLATEQSGEGHQRPLERAGRRGLPRARASRCRRSLASCRKRDAPMGLRSCPGVHVTRVKPTPRSYGPSDESPSRVRGHLAAMTRDAVNGYRARRRREGAPSRPARRRRAPRGRPSDWTPGTSVSNPSENERVYKVTSPNTCSAQGFSLGRRHAPRRRAAPAAGD